MRAANGDMNQVSSVTISLKHVPLIGICACWVLCLIFGTVAPQLFAVLTVVAAFVMYISYTCFSELRIQSIMLQNRGEVFANRLSAGVDQKIAQLEAKIVLGSQVVEQKIDQRIESIPTQVALSTVSSVLTYKTIFMACSGAVMLVKFLFKQEYIKTPQTKAKTYADRAKDVFILALVCLMAYIKWDEIVRGMKGAANYIKKRTKESKTLVSVLGVFGLEPSQQLSGDMEAFEKIADGMSEASGDDPCYGVELTCSLCDQVENWVDIHDHWSIHLQSKHTDRKWPLVFCPLSQKLYWADYIVPDDNHGARIVGIKDRTYVFDRVLDFDAESHIDIISGDHNSSVMKKREIEKKALMPPDNRDQEELDMDEVEEHVETEDEDKVRTMFHTLMQERKEEAKGIEVFHEQDENGLRAYVGVFNPDRIIAINCRDNECGTCRYTSTSKFEWDLHQTVAKAMHAKTYSQMDRIWCNICNRCLGSTGNIQQHIHGGDHMKKRVWLLQHIKQAQGMPTMQEVKDAIKTVPGLVKRYPKEAVVGTGTLAIFLLVIFLLIRMLTRKDEEKAPEMPPRGDKGKKFTRKSLDLVRSYANNFFHKTADADEFFAQVGGKVWRGSREERDRMQREWLDEFEKYFDRYIEDKEGVQMVNNPLGVLGAKPRTEVDQIYDHVRLRADKKIDGGSHWVAIGRGKKGENMFSVGVNETLHWHQAEFKAESRLLPMLIEATFKGAGNALGQRVVSCLAAWRRKKKHDPQPVKQDECVHSPDCPLKLKTTAWSECNQPCKGHHCRHYAGCNPKTEEAKVKYCTAKLINKRCNGKCGNIHDEAKAREYCKSQLCGREKCRVVPDPKCVWGHKAFSPKKTEEKKSEPERKIELKEEKVDKSSETLSGKKIWHSLSTINRVLNSVGIVRVEEEGKMTDWSNCHISANAIHFGYHPIRWIPTSESKIDFVFKKGEQEIIIPLDWARVKQEATDDMSVVLKFDCQSELTKHGLVGLPRANEVPVIGTQVFMISRLNKLRREDHIGDGEVTALCTTRGVRGFPDYIQYNIPTEEGHCFSPICIYAGDTVKLVAVHSAGDLPGKGKHNQGVAVANFQ